MNRYIHPLKKCFIALLAGIFLLAGCNDEYNRRIAELQERVDNLYLLCDQLNHNIASISALVKVIQSRDMITGLTEIREGSVVKGYKINFVNHDPVTIYNGLDGKIPLVASRQDPDDGSYYWTVQYGSDNVQWLLDSYGNRMLSIGKLPFLAIRDGEWYFTEDGKTWIKLGQAVGQNGDTMFIRFDTFNPAYVVIYMSNGEQLKIPTYETYTYLRAKFNYLNENTEAQVEVIKAALDQLVSIQTVAPVLSGTDTVGVTVKLSNGKGFTIHDWVTSMAPVIFVKPYTDGKLYWAYQIGTQAEKWVLDPEGNMIPAASDAVETPLVSVEVGDDGNFYWAVTTGGKTELLRFAVDSTWNPRAVDSVKGPFRTVRDYNDSLVLVLKAGQRYVLPKQYSVWLTDEAGAAVEGTIKMKELSTGDKVTVKYTAHGPSCTLSLLPQGGFTAKAVSGGFTITAPPKFNDGEGKVVAVFSFNTGTAPVSVIKTIEIVK